MITVKHDLREDGYTGDVQVLPLADFHVGDPHADIPLVKRLIKQVEETEHMYCILNGDLMNTAITSSVSDSYDELMKPADQLKRCVDYFGALAEKGKILAITGGNHERRISRSVGVDMTALLAAQLGLASAYSPGAVVLFLQVGANKANSKRKGKRHRPFYYSMFARHGAGGGAMISSKALRLQRYSDVCDADVYIGSHTHNDIVFHDSIYRTDRQHGTVALCDRVYVNTPSALTYGGYGEVGGFRPQSEHHWPIITLHGDKQLVTVEV